MKQKYFQDDDDDVVTIEDDEPTCSTFNSNEHDYSYGKLSLKNFFSLKYLI